MKEVSPRDFTVAWQTSESVEEVSKRTGLPKDVCSARASQLRKLGVNLKKFPAGGRPAIDVEALNRLIEEMGGPPAGKTAVEAAAELSAEDLRRKEDEATARNREAVSRVLGLAPKKPSKT